MSQMQKLFAFPGKRDIRIKLLFQCQRVDTSNTSASGTGLSTMPARGENYLEGEGLAFNLIYF